MMNINQCEKSESISEPHPMRLGNGFKISDSEMRTKSQRQGPTTKGGSPNSPAGSPEHGSTDGTSSEPSNSSGLWATSENMAYRVRRCNGIGQEIVDESTGLTVVWTTSPELAHRIVRLLNQDG